MMLADHVVDDPFGDARDNDHHQRADDGAPERAQRERGITSQITKYAPDRFHLRENLAQSRRLCAQTRSPECLCLSLNVSSAIPDLSRSPKPSAIMRSYCSLVARASGRSRPSRRASSSAIPLSFAACAAEKKQVCSRFCISSPSVSRTREAAPVCEKTFLNISRSRPSAAPSPRPSARPAGLIFITMLTSAFTFAASPALPMNRIVDPSSFKMGSALRNASSLPPHIK